MSDLVGKPQCWFSCVTAHVIFLPLQLDACTMVLYTDKDRNGKMAASMTVNVLMNTRVDSGVKRGRLVRDRLVSVRT